MDPLSLFLTFLKASIFSMGGQSGLPLLRDDLLRAGALTDLQIIDGLIIGRLSTGPGGLYMVSLGFLAGGWLGGVLALVAITLPPLVVLPASMYLRPRLRHPRVNGLVRGLAFTTGGLVVATSLGLLLSSGGSDGPALWQVGLAIFGLVLSLEGKRHPIVIVAVGAIVGLLIAR